MILFRGVVVLVGIFQVQQTDDGFRGWIRGCGASRLAGLAGVVPAVIKILGI